MTTTTTTTATTATPATAAASIAAAAASGDRRREAQTTTHPGSLGRERAALIAGVGYVLLFALAVFANFVVREGLIVGDDAAATAANIADSATLFRLGLLAFLAIFLIDIVVAWALHVVFRSTHHDLSLVAAWSRLVYTVVLGVAAVFFFQALAFYDTVAAADAIDGATREAHALVALELFNATWLIGLAAFGLHLVVLGTLVSRSAETPRLLGVAMIAAGVAYIVDTTAYTVLTDYADHAGFLVVMVAVPSILAEGWLGLWLLARSRRTPTAPAALDLVVTP